MTDGLRGSRRFGRDWGIDHLSLDAVVAYVDDELSAAAHTRAEQHLADCGECSAEVVAQRQVRSALRAADEPRVPDWLRTKLGSIPQDTDLPGPPPGLAVTAEGELVSVLRPEALSPQALVAPAGLDAAHTVPVQSRRRTRVGVTAVSGLALGALAFVGLPSATSSTPPAQPDRGVLGGPVLGTPNAGTARLNTGPTVQPAAVRSTPTPTPSPTRVPER
ncbi:anti-sigma factor [Pseudonocardia sp. WMMC193]|uniref:anti-sigma factor family protein n=1 Tax=Pseudonocardia sp. WMMC193 TaxID=2911965 RepID=UPI001F38EE19|nr:zf-HC2 domain-containing protein [Pseudonocardia sp. WMMC193]MCF7551136.1 zf-HC2 domain-containing protein [Pseudonocardia sp. WMMC193]